MGFQYFYVNVLHITVILGEIYIFCLRFSYWRRSVS